MNNISIRYDMDGVRVTLTEANGNGNGSADDIESLPYNLATIFERIIKDANVNPDVVITELIATFGYDGSAL